MRQQIWLVTGTVGLSLALSAGCRVGRAKRDGEARDSSDQVGSLVLPKRVGESPNPSATPITFDIDEKSSRPRADLVLRLDYFPAPRPGAVNLPACYKPFPADFELGFVSCVGKTDAQRPLLAKNVEQDCYTDPRAPGKDVTEALVMEGCKKAIATVHDFDPKLRVDVELRDVN